MGLGYQIRCFPSQMPVLINMKSDVHSAAVVALWLPVAGSMIMMPTSVTNRFTGIVYIHIRDQPLCAQRH